MADATIRVVGHDLPAADTHVGLHVGVQCRQSVVDQTAADVDSVTFVVPISVVAGPRGPDFRGPYVHGKPSGRFLYLSWGVVDSGRVFHMFRRAKLNFATFPVDVVQALSASATVQVSLGLTDAKGGPLCASVPPSALTWAIGPPG